MASKTNAPGSEESVASRAPICACGFVYVYNRASLPSEEVSLLGNLYVGGEVFSLPLLYDLTVEPSFPLTVKAVHRKMDNTTLNVRLTTFMREVIIFRGTEHFKPIFHGLGLEKLCAAARGLFGFAEYRPPDEPPSVTCDVNGALSLAGLSWPADELICGVAVTWGFKERLMGGNLVWMPTLAERVKIGSAEALKVPLYDEDLFPVQNRESFEHFYHPGVSQYLFYSLFTQIGQSLRIRNIDQVVKATEEQFLKDQYKMSKLAAYKDYPSSIANAADSAVLMVIDAAAAELALSYGMSFLDSPQEATACLNYHSWPLFAEAENEEQRRVALHEFLAKLAVHVHAQIFSANSVFYLNRVGRVQPGGGATAKGDACSFNSFFLHGGLGNLRDSFVLEGGAKVADVLQSMKATDGSSFTVHHLAYAAGFCPQVLARLCFYLQFAQHQKISVSSQQSLKNYLCTAANSAICDLCQGRTPASCVHTLRFRLDDRFPHVSASCKREPYVVTGVTGAFNDLGILGNFASFRERDDEAQSETGQRDTYWRLMQRVSDKLQDLGVDTPRESKLIGDAASFLKVFREVDSTVDREAVSFINNMIKNNVNFRESIKNINHVVQLSCNPNWLPPCTTLGIAYLRSLLAVVQDIALPVCATYEQDNPVLGFVASEWLKLHFQTLWTNFKSACFDKGVLTGSEIKVTHANPQNTGGNATYDFFDVGGNPGDRPVGCKMQVRVVRPLVTVPRMIKLKNRVLFSNTNSSEAIQNSFVRTSKKDNYIVNGPFINFLNTFHRVLFPNCKMSAMYLWSVISEKKQIPLVPGIEESALKELVRYVNTGSLAFDEHNVIDLLPSSLKEYAMQRLNNAILRSCGQTQFYASTVHSLFPILQRLMAEDYPHVLERRGFGSVSEYDSLCHGVTALTTVTSQKHSALEVGKQRPVISLPIIVNKYSGINGNAQIFQCASIGYFSGRGVDRNLFSDTMRYFKRQSTWSFMRKKYIFMTPLTDSMIRKSSQSVSWNLSDVEALKKNISSLLEEPTPELTNKITLECVKLLGRGCVQLRREDLDFYLGHLGFLSDEIVEKLDTLKRELERDEWTAENAAGVLARSSEGGDDGLQGLEFVGLDDGGSSQLDDVVPVQAALSLNRKRKFGLIGAGEIDL